MNLLKSIFLPHKPERSALEKSAYSFSFTDIKTGKPLPLSKFSGQAVLVVNTASKCMFTPQYKDMQELWQQYKDKGLVVIAVPSNDFGEQEKGTNSEIKQFCRKNYSVNFPVMEKEVVRGNYAHPFYKWAVEILGGTATPRWNFHKYLISPEGNLVDFFLPFTRLNSQKVIKKIEEILGSA